MDDSDDESVEKKLAYIKASIFVDTLLLFLKECKSALSKSGLLPVYLFILTMENSQGFADMLFI